MHVYKVSRSYNTEDDSAKPRLRFPMRERLYTYIDTWQAQSIPPLILIPLYSARSKKENTSRAYQKLEEKAGMYSIVVDTFIKKRKKNWGNNRRRSKSVPRRKKKKNNFFTRDSSKISDINWKNMFIILLTFLG